MHHNCLDSGGRVSFKMNLLQQILSIKNEDSHKIICVLGIKIKFKAPLKGFLKGLKGHIRFIAKQTIEYYEKQKSYLPLEPHVHLCNNCYKEYFLTQNLMTKYQTLIKGLDSCSIDVIGKIINRVSGVLHNNQSIFGISEKEKEELKKNDIRGKQLLQFSNGIYCLGKYFLPVNYFIDTIFIHRYFINEIKNINKISNKAIVDVGAFVGDSALIFAEYTNNKVYAFEPVNANYEGILKTIKLNDSKNIIPVKLGLGKENAETFINVFETTPVSSTLREDRKNNPYNVPEKITIVKLDDYVKEHNIRVGLIKADIEGAEQDFLSGAKETIIEQKPVLLISIYHTASDLFDIKPHGCPVNC